MAQTTDEYQKLEKAIEEGKQLTRELHGAIKDATKIHKEIKAILSTESEDLVLHVLGHLLPSAILVAEDKAADHLIKLNEVLRQEFHKQTRRLQERMDKRDKEFAGTAEAVVDLTGKINKLIDLQEGNYGPN